MINLFSATGLCVAFWNKTDAQKFLTRHAEVKPAELVDKKTFETAMQARPEKSGPPTYVDDPIVIDPKTIEK